MADTEAGKNKQLVEELRALSQRGKEDESESENESGIDSSVVCPKCEATKVAKSRTFGFDNVRVRFLPERPYRCLHCYDRFWAKEPLLSDKRRVWAWAILLAVLLLIGIISFLSSSSDQDYLNPDYPIINTGNVPPGYNDGTGGLGDGEQGGNSTLAGDTASPEQRKLIEDFEFAPVTGDEALPDAELLAEQNEAEAARLAAIEEKESLLKVKIAYSVEQWRKAWQSGNTNSYFDSYADEFTPAKNQTPLAWRNQRKIRVKSTRKIELQLENFEVSFGPEYDTATVLFDQHYKAADFVDQSRKELGMIEKNGRWMIVTERELD